MSEEPITRDDLIIGLCLTVAGICLVAIVGGASPWELLAIIARYPL